MAEYVVAQAAVLIVPTLGKGPDSFQAKLEKEMLKIQRKALEIKVKADTDEMVRDVMLAKKFVEKDPIKLKLVIDQQDRRKLTEIRHQYEDLARDVKKGLLLNLKIAGLSLMPQLASGLAAANASMVQLSQTAVLLPGLLAGVASSVSTLMAGLSGVKGAFKEFGDAQKNAAAEGLKARNSALNVKNAYRDLGRTMKDAQRNLEDLNAELRGAPLDEADAIIRVQEAYAELANASEKSGLQRQKDALAVKRAENDLADTRLRNSRLIADVAEANAKGVAGSDAVLDASERLSKALDDVSTKATKASDALRDLSPNAQQFVTSVTGMRGEWDAFRSSVQDRLFDGLGAEVVKLGQNDLPVLQKGFSAIAGEINGNLKVAIASLQTDTNKGFLDRIFGNTAAAQGSLDKAINPFIDAMLRLSAVGTNFLPRLSDGLADLLTRFDNFIVRAESDGSLNTWIEGGIDAFKDLGNSLLNVGSILNSLSEAFIGSGGTGLLGSLESGTQKLAEFLRSAEGQERLASFFAETRQQLAQWRPLLDALPGLIANVSNAAQDWANMLLPFLRTAATALSEHPGLVQAAFGAYIAWNGIKPIVMGVSNVIGIANNSIDFFKQKVDEAGNKISGSSGFKGKLGLMAAAITSPGGVITALTSLATYLIYNVVAAHDAAAQAAQRQRADLDKLATSLDDVTGAATRATNSMVAKNFREGINEATGASNGDLTKAVPNMPLLTEKIVAGDLQGALGLVRGADAATIERTDAWKDNKDSLEAKGITSDVLAKAVNGDPDARAKFEEWRLDTMRRKAGRGITDPNDLQGLENARVITNTVDLLEVQNQLPSDIRTGSQVQGEIYSNTFGIQQGGDIIRQDSNNAFGRARLIAGNPFDGLGVIQAPQLSADGAGLLTSSAPAVGSAQEEQLRNDGVTFRMDGPGRYIVSMTQDAANKYLESYAHGGLINGPGSGTSDSILARLSHGEYVVNAASTARHLPLLEQLNGGSLPAFAPGGPVVPKPPVPTPGSIGSVLGTVAKSNSTKIRVGGGAGVSSGTISTPNSYDTAVRAGVSNVGNFFKGALGLGAPGYTETSTAKLPVTPPRYNGYSLVDSLGLAPDQRQIAQGNVASSGAPSTQSAVTDPSSQLYGIAAGTKPSGVPFPKSGDSGKAPVAPTKPVTQSAPSATKPVTAPVVPSATKPVTAPSATKPVSPTISGGGLPVAPPATTPSLAAEAGYAGPPKSVVPAMADAITGAGFVPTPIQAQIVEGVTPEVNFGAQEAAKYGLKVTSGLRFTDTGFHSLGQAGDYSNQVQYGPPTPEMNAFASEVIQKYAPYIDELIYAGVPNNIYRGQVVPAIDMPGSPYTTDQADYHGDHVHIAWKTGALEQLKQLGLTGPQLQQLGIPGAPSNMPMAGTPTGIGLPQLTFAPGGNSAMPGLLGGPQGQFKMPTPEEYVKAVSKSWSETIDNLVKNAGQIALKFIGSFFGLDFSGILGTANAIMGGFDQGDSKGGQEDSNLPANADVEQIMANAGLLPPEYQNQYLQAVQQNPSQATPLLNQIMAMAQQQNVAAKYNPAGGVAQWRPVVQAALNNVGYKYGITNMQAWEEDILGQIQLESGGDPTVNNLNDSDGKGGTQQVFGLGQFHPQTFAAHNITNGDISDPVAQIYAMIDYLASPKYGVIPDGGVNWKGVGWRNGKGYASGGKISGKGSGRSDSILAKVSNGEYLVKASAAQKNMGLLNAINSDSLPGFADGMMWPVNAPAPVTPPPVAPPPTTPPPPPSPVPPPPAGPQADAAAGQPTAPAPVTATQGAGGEASNALQEVGGALSGIGSSISGVAEGATAPAGDSPTSDPRSIMGAAPQNLDHNNPAVSAGIQAAGSAISGAINTAIQAGAMAASAGGSAAAGPAAGAASGLVSGLVGAGAGAVSGAVNILSSLLVGTATTNGSTAGAYGTPMLPNTQQSQYSGPAVVNNWNGGVHTSNNDEFYQIQQRRELQNSAPYLPNR